LPPIVYQNRFGLEQNGLVRSLAKKEYRPERETSSGQGIRQGTPMESIASAARGARGGYRLEQAIQGLGHSVIEGLFDSRGLKRRRVSSGRTSALWVTTTPSFLNPQLRGESDAVLHLRVEEGGLGINRQDVDAAGEGYVHLLGEILEMFRIGSPILELNHPDATSAESSAKDVGDVHGRGW